MTSLQQSSTATTTGPSRWPAPAVFFLNGLVLATWIVRVPALKEDHDLSDGQLGTLGLLFGVAALTAMQSTGSLAARFGTAAVLRTSLVGMPALLAVVGLAEGFGQLGVALVLLAALHGITDATMNSYAIAVERQSGRQLLNSCHAAWSASAILASLVAVALTAAGTPTSTHLLAVALLALAAGLLLSSRLEDPEPEQGDRREHLRWRDGWTRTVVGLGITGHVLMLCEGAVLGRGAAFLRDGRGSSLALAAASVTAFTTGQLSGRLVGDRLAERFGAQRLFRTGGLVAVLGLAGALLAPDPRAAVAGFAVLGLGGSVLIPLTFGAVGRVGGSSPAATVARFTTFTYAGILLEPALVGWSAEWIGLSWALLALVPLLAAVVLLTRLPD